MGEDRGVGLLVIALLILAAVTGVLWQVLEIAIGVALGIFLAGVLIALAVFFLARRAMRDYRRDQQYRGDRPYDV
jgi:membrane protein implicated in regulation of membrane protease activity